MPGIYEELSAEWHEAAGTMRHLMHPHLFSHHDAPQPAEAIPTTQEEATMSLQVISEIEDAIKSAASKFETIDHDALALVDDIKANPLATEAFQIIGALTGLPAADFTTALSVLRMTLAAAGGQLPQQQVPQPIADAAAQQQ